MSEVFLYLLNRVRWTDERLGGRRGRPEEDMYRVSSPKSKSFASCSCLKLEDAGCGFGRRRGVGDVSESK